MLLSLFQATRLTSHQQARGFLMFLASIEKDQYGLKVSDQQSDSSQNMVLNDLQVLLFQGNNIAKVSLNNAE